MSIPLDQADGNHKSAMFCQSKVCTDVIYGYDCGDAVADWISNALEVSFLRLIRQSNDNPRVQKKKGKEDQKLLSLSNQAQYLLINKATVRWLSDKIQDPMFADSVDHLTDRFRGNIIIDMGQELAERDWHRVIIGKHEFKVNFHYLYLTFTEWIIPKSPNIYNKAITVFKTRPLFIKFYFF